MANVFIYPDDDATARPYFDVTGEMGCEIEALLPLVGGGDLSGELKHVYPEGKCYFWGAQETVGNYSAWNVMTKDDLVLGYRNNSIALASYALMTMKNPLLETRLWRGTEEQPFSLLCFTTKPHFSDIGIEPQMSSYLNMDCRGFTCLKQEKRDNILRDYGSFEVFVRYGLGLDFPSNFRHTE